MANIKVRVSNFLLGVALNTAFRTSYSVDSMRRNFEFLAGTSLEGFKKKFPMTRFETIQVGNLTLEEISTTKNPIRTVLFLHGGGYYMGSISTYRRNALRISYLCNAKVVLPEYRLAPEHPFPAALDDAMKAYEYLLQSHSPSSLILGGDSAGGGLALALGCALRDQGKPIPDGIFALSPWTDLTGSGPSVIENASNDVWLSKANMEVWAPWYIGNQDVRNPYISPVFAEYRGFPRLLLFVGDQEVLLSDSSRVADSARAAGVDVRLHVGRGMQHDWFFSLPFLKESRAAFKELKQFLVPE